MRYTQPLSDQILIFISSIGPGILIGFLYDVIFSFFRTFGNKKSLTITADLLFSLSAGMLSFFYMVIYNSGVVRLNIVVAQLIGAVTFHYTLGRYLSKPVEFTATMLTKLIKAIAFPFKLIFKKSAEYAKKICPEINVRPRREEKSKPEKKKIINILKIHLKK